MISFTVLNNENIDKIVAEITSGCDCSEDLARELLDSFDNDDGIEYAISVCHGCVLVRVFDMGRYIFIFPITMGLGNEEPALEQMCDYAVKEEIPFVLSDVPKEELEWVVATFRHMNIDAMDEGYTFRLEARSECSLLDEEPELHTDTVSLTPLCEEDIPLMARLNRDGEVNKYWGYDYREDYGDVDDAFFLRTAREEFARGTALTLAIREGEEYIGEVIYHAFNLRGSAEIGLRLLPEYQGRGLGSETIDAIITLGRRIGLMSLSATVDKNNKRSRRLMSRRFRKVRVEGTRAHYEYEYGFDD